MKCKNCNKECEKELCEECWMKTPDELEMD